MKLHGWLTRHWVKSVIILAILLAAALRLYQLGQVPHGFSWDEAAIGYNGWSVWTTRRDEWLHFMPISFASFSDYKAPLAIYLNGFFTVLLGLQPWVVRLPFALSGIVGVAGLMWLTFELGSGLAARSPALQPKIRWWSVAAGLLLAITPWHIHFTRIGMESGLALTLVILGTACWLRFVNLVKDQVANISQFWLDQHPASWWWLSIFWLIMSLYAYHSTKMVTPILGIGLLVVSWRVFWQAKKIFLTGTIFGLLLAVPLVADAVFGHGASRLSGALIPIEGRSTLEIAQQLLNNFTIHFSPAFLVLGETPTLRHGDGAWGVLLWPTLLLAVIGLVTAAVLILKRLPWDVRTRLSLLSLIWIAIAYLPATIGWEVPHANRALLALPGWIWLAIAGLDWLIVTFSAVKWDSWCVGSHGEKKLVLKALVGLIILSHGLFFLTYLHHYYTVFAAQSANDFQDGYLEAFKFIIPYERGTNGHRPVDKILMDNEYGQPYIYALFARQTSPIAYHGGSLIKYEFPDKLDDGAILRPNAVIVATGGMKMPWEKATKIIYGTDGSIRFGIFVNQD